LTVTGTAKTEIIAIAGPPLSVPPCPRLYHTSIKAISIVPKVTAFGAIAAPHAITKTKPMNRPRCPFNRTSLSAEKPAYPFITI
jgi:hypothetical protein